MVNHTQLESHHGVLMRVASLGVLIIGPAGVGKSSLALELISQGHQLIADDVVEFSRQSNLITGYCPPMLEGLLHTRELGLISILTIFGQDAWQQQQTLDVVISLQSTFTPDIKLTAEKTYPLLGLSFPLLTLSTDNPASLSHRIQCWLMMQTSQHQPENELKQRQRTIMSTTKLREIS
ncbi:MAG: serine kinase [Gammaproteobacteria bacterium]|nr:serine kinase [Gammaproteobacteria bacterium]